MMPSDLDSDSSSEQIINLDSSLPASKAPAPDRVVYKYKEYTRRPALHAAETPSVIWYFGDEYERKKQKFWRCGLCKHHRLLAMNNGTTSALRHLSKNHKIDKKGRGIKTKQPTITTVSQNVAQIVTRFASNTFRYLLIRWIVTMHIALSCVESDTFQNWVCYIAPALDSYVVRSGKTIRRWILWEFAKQRHYIKTELATARSRIHISFDLWTSPNSKGLLGVVFHFLDKDLKARNLLAGLRRVKGAHSGENIAEAVIPIIEQMISKDQIGFFIGDNASTNDTAIRAILSSLLPKLSNENPAVET